MIRITLGLSCFLILCACGGGGGDQATDSTAQPSGDNRAPLIGGTPVTRIWEEDAYVFAPLASDPDGDALSFEIVNRPRWAAFDPATGRLTGQPTAADVGTHSAVRIRVSDGELGGELPPFDITVEPVSYGSVTLTWTPPSENTDDSVLEDLAGFNIYWGTDPADLAHRVSVVGAGITAYLIDNLSPGRYYFATTALNSFGIESARSDFAIVVVR